MQCKCLLLLLLVHGCAIRNGKCQTSSAIPSIIQNCYRRNFTITARPPTTLPLLIELIRKIELDNRNSITTRLLTSSIVHGVLFNGIRRNPDISQENDNVIPYRATGAEFYRYQVLVDYLIPGQIELFPRESLTLPELCYLHALISSTVDPLVRGDESYSCNDRSSMPLEFEDKPLSRCPLRKGVIKTTWGAVSIGHVLLGIAAGLQDNRVSFDQLSSIIASEKSKQATHESPTSEDAIDIVWVATMAGDLAGAIVNQSTGNLVIGNPGFWNDTLFPRAYYLKSNTWDMIEADVLGGIDGAFLGTYVKRWLDKLDSTRLSQILDMYYSERGIPFEFGHRANNRSTTLNYLINNVNLEEQIIGSTKLLQAVGGSGATLSESGIREFTRIATVQFKSMAGDIATQYDKIEYLDGKQMMAPIELIIILDGTFDYYKALQMIYTLSEAIQVSRYGSKLGVINGQSGNWIVNVTRELFQIFTDLNELKDQWPATLSLGTSLQTAIAHYQNRTYVDCSSKKIQPFGQVIIVFSKDGRLTDNDAVKSFQSISTIKQSYPGTRIFYMTSRGDNSIQQLLQENDAIINPSNDVLSLVTKVTERLSKVPANIITFYCNHSDVIIEDYITPNIPSFYEIHNEYLRRAYVDTRFINSDYGELIVCAFKRNTNTEDKTCKRLTVNDEISIRSKDFCTPESACDLQFQVSANTTKLKCTENDCRYPDQIRMNIRYTYYSSVPKITCSVLVTAMLNVLLIAF